MKSEFPPRGQDKTAAPHEQAVEYALILSRMINTVKDDPSQMRQAVYSFARARLDLDTSWIDEAERTRLLSALETAIRGVETFSTSCDNNEQLTAPKQSAQITASNLPDELPSGSVVEIHRLEPRPRTVPGVYSWDSTSQAVEPARLSPMPRRFWIGTMLTIATMLIVAIAGVSVQQIYALRHGVEGLEARWSTVTTPAVLRPFPQTPQLTPPTPDVKASVALTQPFPLPADYGVYALSSTGLSELRLLPEQLPDKRVAISTPINQSSSTILADGKAKFVVFRRDLAGNTPDRIEVRVVARVVRALKFDAKGKPNFSPVSDTWNIRNSSYEFRVRPIAGNPEMLLVQPEHPDFILPAGRYALALRNQGYDFTIAGKVTDLAQCLERTDAANGTFYSDCTKP